MNKCFILILCFALFALVACSDNLFGSPSSNSCGTDIKCLRLDAESAFRSGDYAKSYSIYSQIVGIDSTASAGYFGMAKSGLWMKGINPFSMFAHVKMGGDSIAFMNDFPVEQNKFYQGMRFIAPVLRELEKRDTLTAHYGYYKRKISGGFDTVFVKTMDSASWVRTVEANGFNASDLAKIGVLDNGEGKNKTYTIPLSEKLKKFIETYRCDASGNCSGVPLSDREYSYDSYTVGLLITTIAETILKSLDTNKDGCIAKKCPDSEDCTKYHPGDPGDFTNLLAWRNWGCEIKNKYSYDLSINLAVNDNGEFEVDINDILEDLNLDEFYQNQLTDPNTELPEDIRNFNENMDDFNESMYEILSVMGAFKDRSSSDDVPFGWESDLGGYRDYSSFYKVGTNIDEDGDGCIGEDILDGQDNDGDGLKNNNARLAPTDIDHQYYATDGIMGFHGMTGNPDDDKPLRINIDDPAFKRIANNPERTLFAALNPDEDGVVTVMAFTQRDGYWTSNNYDDKLKVAQDTVCPPKFSLEERKALIGGCWLNYDETKFVDYWLKRGLARPEDKINRIHSSCKSCTGAGCLR